MRNIKNKKMTAFCTAALIVALSHTPLMADALNNDAAPAVNQQNLTDWGYKARVALNKKIEENLTAQLLQHNQPQRIASILPQQYQTANLVLSGQKLAHSNLAPLSSIPVVIIQNPQADCLFKL